MTLTLDQILYTLLEGDGAKSVVIRRNKNPKGLKYSIDFFDRNIHIEEEYMFATAGNNLRDILAETLSHTPTKADTVEVTELEKKGTVTPKYPLPTPIEVLDLINQLWNLRSHAIAAVLECTKDEADDIVECFDDNSFVLVLGALRRLGNNALSNAVQYLKDERAYMERIVP